MHTLARGISYTDLEFLGRSRVIATAVVENAGGVSLVDPGPTTCLPKLKAGLAQLGLGLGDVRSLLLTHIHLDHAGATGTLVRENPAIEVFVHERGAKHMIDPARLLESAGRLYGAEMDRLWGEVCAVPAANVRALTGGEHVDVGERRFEVAYTPGHASHHVSYFDRSTGIAFVGDTAGIRTGPTRFVLPPTPPPDIDLEAWHQSLELIEKWSPETLFITHFGPHQRPKEHLDALRLHLGAISEMARGMLSDAGDDEQMMMRFGDALRVYLRRYLPDSEVVLYGQAAPLGMGWLGLARYWRKRA